MHIALFITAYLIVTNSVAAGLFWKDKQNARESKRRISEATLLWAAAVGGSLGAKWAQRRFRHKTRKQPFGLWLNVIFWVQVGSVLWAGALVLL